MTQRRDRKQDSGARHVVLWTGHWVRWHSVLQYHTARHLEQRMAVAVACRHVAQVCISGV